ncbi:RNA polymerase sigma factor [Luteolibacter soli]|uniref:RNA polymerase subunit sigma-24 n=1 Tax=Luteolibacter soli TaxID=3135280 RepID=A0ABU9AUZ8_9BACT
MSVQYHDVRLRCLMFTQETHAAFPPTRWSLVVSSRDNDHGALEELCRLYWPPLYSFGRRSGLTIEDAQDLTQRFFHDLLENRAALLEKADPGGGRLRTLFLKVLQRRIADHHRHATREKRGSGQVVSLDTEAAEAGLRAVAPGISAEAVFDRHWALQVLHLALARLELDFATAGRSHHFTALVPFLGLGADDACYRTLRDTLNLDESRARQAVHRFRDRFRRHLRDEIAETIATDDDEAIDRELNDLRAILSRAS